MIESLVSSQVRLLSPTVRSRRGCIFESTGAAPERFRRQITQNNLRRFRNLYV